MNKKVIDVVYVKHSYTYSREYIIYIFKWRKARYIMFIPSFAFSKIECINKQIEILILKTLI